jgi:hypothetical protein
MITLHPEFSAAYGAAHVAYERLESLHERFQSMVDEAEAEDCYAWLSAIHLSGVPS